jgi:hypothetical protein
MAARKLNCKEASRYISQGLDKDMSAADRTSLRMHLAVCDACNKFKAQLVFLRRAVAALAGRGANDDGSPRS